jgi:hypothetical protein
MLAGFESSDDVSFVRFGRQPVPLFGRFAMLEDLGTGVSLFSGLVTLGKV